MGYNDPTRKERHVYRRSNFAVCGNANGPRQQVTKARSALNKC